MPVAPTLGAQVVWRPLRVPDVGIDGGFWAARQRVNREVSIPQGGQRLREAGNLDDLRLAADGVVDPARFRGPWFMDSDVHKWLEAVAWEQAREPSDHLASEQRELTAAVAAAQLGDGYLNSYVQVKLGPEKRFTELPWSHELYCAGHLIQAAVAQHRVTGDAVLLSVATRFADLLVETFGPDRLDDVDGHPVIEMALVELYRAVGDARYLELARYTVEARGHGLLQKHGNEPTYFSDRVPVRQAETVEGHAVRAVYLAAGAADLAAETGDETLLAALGRQWQHMVDTKMYLTGGFGSRWEGEAFGDPYELPPDRAYGETCAAIGGIQWSWRMLLATTDPRYADLMERQLYNAFLPGVSLDGEKFFYVNALQVRGGSHGDDQRHPVHGRRPWFDVACCPPNIMRMLSQLSGYLATTGDDGLQLHQYASGTVQADIAGERVALQVATEYPWDGRVEVVVQECPDQAWTLSLRVPAWAAGATVKAAGDPADEVTPGSYVALHRAWRPGERVVLTLPMEPLLTLPHPRIDAVRGCAAIERGPLVYCIEQVDNPDVAIDDVRLAPGGDLTGEHRADLLGGVTVVHATGRVHHADEAGRRDVPLTAIPYLAWANRGTDQGTVGPMRVWIPTS
jgi:DUF1680 family protein